MTLKELKYIIYGEDRMGATLDKISGAGSKTDNVLNNVTKKVNNMDAAQQKAAKSGNFMSSVLGGASSQAMRMIAPMLGAAGAVGAVTLAFNRGIKAAAEFRMEWRKLENLNMSLSDGQLDTLRNQVLGISMLNKLDPGKTSQAYFDVQSLTGNKGVVTESIISRQAEFAKAFQADINAYVAGTAKAMKNYGFGYEGIDEYNKANLGVFSTGYINMDQLAKVSSVYAGAASSANQSVASANKLMSLFTVLTKSPDEAATLTKSAFTDLFKKDIAKTFKDLGIDLYDVRGRAKQVDQIMMELNAKFADKTSAQAMDDLRNKFSGSEGINALLSAAKDQSGAMLETFRNFDNAANGLDKALNRAKNDINVINDDINMKLKSSMTLLGEALLPVFIQIKKIISDGVDLISRAIPGYNQIRNRALIDQEFQKELESRSKVLQNIETDPASVEQARGVWQGYLNQARNYLYNDKGFPILRGAQDAEKVYRMQKQEETYNALLKMYDEAIAPGSAAGGSGGNSGGAPTPDDSKIKSMMQGIAGGGTRNITVSIEKMIEEFNVNTTNLRESPEQVKTLIEETLVRAVAGAEQTLSN